jgi:hypothetical protein
METNNHYLKYMSEIWAIKEKIFTETEKMDFKQYSEYLQKSIKHLKERFKDKYVHVGMEI